MKKVLILMIAVMLLAAGCQPAVPDNQGPIEIQPDVTPAPTPLTLKTERTSMLAAGSWHIALLRNDGSVLAAGSNNAGQSNVSEWKNVDFIAAGQNTTVGLSGGKLLIAGAKAKDWEAALSWENIVEVAVGESHIVGLKSDGTVLAAGDNSLGQCDVTLWKNIVEIKAAANDTLGKSADGEIFTAGSESAALDAQEAEIPEIKDGTWVDAVNTVQNENIRAAILSDGSVVCAGEYEDLSNLTANWNANETAMPASVDPNAEKQSTAVQKNDDVRGYITVPGVDIDRPILFGEKWYYNDHSFDKESSDAGEVYLYVDAKQQINAITAHNMRVSGTMFHELHHIQAYNNGLTNCEYKKCDAELTDNLPDLTKYSDRVWNISLFGFTRWEVFSYYEVDEDESANTLYYNTNFTKDPSKLDVEEWIMMQNSRSEIKLDVEVTTEDTFLTILTCGDEHDSSDAQSRLYIFLKAVG